MHTKHSEETKRKISATKKAQHIIPKSAFKKGFIPWNKGKPMLITSERNKLNNPGGKKETHWNWKGGVSKIDKIVRRMPEYIKWRSDVFNRDYYTCQECSKTNTYLTVHHIVSFASIIASNKIKSTDDARLCSMLWDITNGITLCEDCHSKTDNYRKRVSIK